MHCCIGKRKRGVLFVNYHDLPQMEILHFRILFIYLYDGFVYIYYEYTYLFILYINIIFFTGIFFNSLNDLIILHVLPIHLDHYFFHLHQVQ